MNYICLDGKQIRGDQPALAIDNKSYRYGDGIFETLKVYQHRILLAEAHFNRFFGSLKTLEFDVPALLSPAVLQQAILELCEKNRCADLARVRLTAFRGNGGIYDGDTSLHYSIECWALASSVNQLNENGLDIGVYPHARKSCDMFSNLKSANYLPYVMAARYAKQHKLNDCLVLNTWERIADASIANLFVVVDGAVITPALTEGGVDGVMRRYLVQQLRAEERPVSADELIKADEVFLTNAVSGIRWVKQCGEKLYTNTATVSIYKRFIKTFFD